MATVIPGALADHLTNEPPFDLDTRATLDAARRGRGRTLVIEPKNITPLHVISRRAEYLLGDAYATRAQKDAARTWLKRAGHAPQIITVRYASTEEAYNASQCCAEIRNGDVLVVEAEAAVAFLYDAWPVAVTAAHGEFHGDGTAPTVEAARGASVRTAVDAAYAIGAPLARAEDQADAEQALAEAAAADAPEANPTVEQALDAVEAEAAARFEQAAHVADAVEHAEQVEAGVETVADAVALYDTYIATAEAAVEPVRCTLHGDQCDHDPGTPHHFADLHIGPPAARTAPTICPEFVALDPDDLIADEWRTAAALVTEAEATEGTWRGAWIGEQPADDVLFVVDGTAEQGALFRTE
ncbi:MULTISPECIES: hypothetical protein [unclassified Streptomyces]|uniref:hypothetical protein n=1 Tax=unclassified Streptomyces TaxID=2593676 RepID=UPI00344D8EE6